MRYILFIFSINVALVWTANDSRPKNHRFSENDELSLNTKEPSKSKFAKLNTMVSYGLETDKENAMDLENENEKFSKPWDSFKKSDRVQFQIEGHEGPETYMFGFDTGHGSRQFRLEERYPDGTVKGQYGYYDATGKLRTVHYVASPVDGYTERHHESNVRTLKN
ncbi:uncharacterized protein LOC143361396 isoform X2 [Halictus rubicundus]|uniref:uncharacterized protein LOC143361396 isoform X2 n=1 Tax=Halictus rubicundus TaxID=77578 RepID=UPI004035216F